jgi:hypothetical protein
METAVANPARFLAFADTVPVVLRDVEDLHDADLDGVLADRLDDAGVAAASATALAELVGRPARNADLAHALGARAMLLALL